MAISCTLRADLFSFFALVSAVAEFITFVTLCDWSVFFNVNVIGRHYLRRDFDTFVFDKIGLLFPPEPYFYHLSLRNGM